MRKEWGDAKVIYPGFPIMRLPLVSLRLPGPPCPFLLGFLLGDEFSIAFLIRVLCVSIKLHTTGQPGPEILIFQYYEYGPVFVFARYV